MTFAPTLPTAMSRSQLTTEIISLSVATTWDAAKIEWELQEVYRTEKAQRCLCGHFPIIELCILMNVRNGNTSTLGNCCVKRFTDLPSDKIFQALKRIRKDIAKSLNEESIHYASKRGWLTAWEMDFYIDIMRKRDLSDKQLAKKKQINERVLKRTQK